MPPPLAYTNTWLQQPRCAHTTAPLLNTRVAAAASPCMCGRIYAGATRNSVVVGADFGVQDSLDILVEKIGVAVGHMPNTTPAYKNSFKKIIKYLCRSRLLSVRNPNIYIYIEP